MLLHVFFINLHWNRINQLVQSYYCHSWKITIIKDIEVFVVSNDISRISRYSAINELIIIRIRRNKIEVIVGSNEYR